MDNKNNFAKIKKLLEAGEKGQPIDQLAVQVLIENINTINKPEPPATCLICGKESKFTNTSKGHSHAVIYATQVVNPDATIYSGANNILIILFICPDCWSKTHVKSIIQMPSVSRLEDEDNEDTD